MKHILFVGALLAPAFAFGADFETSKSLEFSMANQTASPTVAWSAQELDDGIFVKAGAFPTQFMDFSEQFDFQSDEEAFASMLVAGWETDISQMGFSKIGYNELALDVQSPKYLSNIPNNFLLSTDIGSDGLIDISDMPFDKSAPIDLLELYDENDDFDKLVSVPKGMSSQAVANEIRRRNRRVKPRLAQDGDRIASSLEHLMMSVAEEMCAMPMRPTKLLLEVEAGIDFFASFKGLAQIEIDLIANCSG